MSNELVRQPQNTLESKMSYAQAMAGSNLLPTSYRNNPANLLFALEYAEALGVAPIHAITSIHVISGKPSASADLIAATIRKAGHILRVEGDDTYAVARLTRSDDKDYTFEARWDLDKARKAGLNTATWKAYPGAMLRSRAITEVGRMGASDALYGVQYTPEELGAEVDAGGVPVQAKPTTKPAPAKSRIAQAMAQPEPEPLADLGERRDWLAEAEQAEGDVDTIRALWIDAQAAGESPETLDKIKALATPRADEPAS